MKKYVLFLSLVPFLIFNCNQNSFSQTIIHKSWAEKGMKKYSKFKENDKVRILPPDWYVELEDLTPEEIIVQ